MGKSVLVIGSSCVDVIIRVERLPRTEECVHPESQHFSVGGCAYNVANILGRGGADTVFVTPVGLKGVFGPYVLGKLRTQPWCRPVELTEEENGCCYCLVEAGGERTFLSVHGAEYTFSPEWMIPYRDRRFDYTYICGLETEEKTGEALIGWLENASRGTLLYAPGPRGARVPRERTERLLRLHTILHLNRSEALQMGRAEDVTRAMRNLRKETGNTVIVTLGPDGALLLDGPDAPAHVPGVSVPRVEDTIGAGDAHAGAVLLALSRGENMLRAVEFANRVAAEAVTQAGATLTDDRVLRP